jgi:hypothetical protein
MIDGIGNTKPSATRPSTAGSVPTRNIQLELATGGPSALTSSRLNTPSPMITADAGGFTVTSTRWVGR